MAHKTELWQVENEQLVDVPAIVLDKEKRLQEWIAKNPKLLDMEILIIGKEVITTLKNQRNRIDLLAIDKSGDVVIIELKKGQTPREVIAQTLDYASWVDTLTPIQIRELSKKHLGDESKIDTFLDDSNITLNINHKIIIVAAQLDDASERIVQYLANRHNLNINVIFFNFHKNNKGEEYLSKSWLTDFEEQQEKIEIQKQGAEIATDYYFFNVGEGGGRTWEVCKEYRFLSAGGALRFKNFMQNFEVGNKIFAYVKGGGYVGYGTVTAKAVRIQDFKVNGQLLATYDLPEENKGLFRNSNNDENVDYAIGIEWRKTLEKKEGIWEKNMFVHRQTTCRLYNKMTVDILEKKFGIKKE